MAEDGFLGRWSRRKTDAGAGRRPGRGGAAPVVAEEAAPADSETELGALSADAPSEAREIVRPGRSEQPERDDQDDPPATAADIAALPDIENLTATSDFTGFLRKGVPEALQRQALRKLWPLDPVLANVDGLVDYGEDFTQAASLVANIKTSYQVGRGFQSDEDLARNDSVYQAEQKAKLDALAADEDAPDEPCQPDDEVLAEVDGDGENERDGGAGQASAGELPEREVADAGDDPAPDRAGSPDRDRSS